MPPAASGDGALPPVPDDETPTPPVTQLPWSQIPKFIPGTTNVQEYTQKLKFLASLWPVEYLDQLAPRAALLIEGTAFRKIARIPPAKLKVKSTDGIATLVEAIGGSWGSTELEERYEYFEKSLYGTIQRSDESHDSFLSRMESNFMELLARNTTLEEVQAYVLLRQSTLSAEDKKRILLEHEGELKYKPVVKSFRLLGSKFFSEFQSGRSSQKTKVYEANVLETSEAQDGGHHFDSGHSERAFHTQVDDFDHELDQEFLETLIAQEDADALTVSTFEGEFEDFLQETPEMFEALTTYMEVRSKLIEKKKSRGFWPIKGKSKNPKGRGKGFGKRTRDRDALLLRISKSHCRRCGALGHWKAECPQAGSGEKSQGSMPSASANVVVDERPQEVFNSCAEVDEVFSEDDEYEMPAKETSLHSSHVEAVCFMLSHECRNQGVVNLSQRMSKFNKNRNSMGKPAVQTQVQEDMTCLPRKFRDSVKFSTAFGKSEPSDAFEISTSMPVYSSLESFCTHAILDTGASRCIIGEKTLEKLKLALPDGLVNSFRKQSSQVKFRFGNNQTLTSQYAIQIPLKHIEHKKHWLSVEVVPGATPFLFSKRAFKMLQGSLDSKTDQCLMHKVQRKPITLATSHTGLYLVNMLDICHSDEVAMFQETASTETISFFQSKFDWGKSRCKTSNPMKYKEIDGVNQFSLATVESKTPFQQMRSFRSSAHIDSTQRFAVSESHHASDGQRIEVDRRSSHPPAHLAPADLCEPAGKARGAHRDGDREQSRDPDATPGDDEADPTSERLLGSSQGRDQQSKEDPREEDSGHHSECCHINVCGKFHDDRRRAAHWNDSTASQGTISGVTGGKLGGDRRGGGDFDSAESAKRAIDYGLQPQSTGATSTDTASSRTFVPGGMGIQHHQFWPQAQREDLCDSDATGSRVPELEPGTICQPDARALCHCMDQSSDC